MGDRDEIQPYERAMSVLASGGPAALEELAQELDSFPEGVDPFLRRRWIINAIHSGSFEAIRWIVSRGVELNFRDEEGYTPLHAAIDREEDDKAEVLALLLEAGAPVDLKGLNDWTPSHMAAARDDVESLRLLVEHGADLTIRTKIDDYATPLEEARNLRSLHAVKFLEGIHQGSD